MSILGFVVLFPFLLQIANPTTHIIRKWVVIKGQYCHGFGGIHADIGAKSRFLTYHTRLSFKGFLKFPEMFKRDLNLVDKRIVLSAYMRIWFNGQGRL
jgi:hypothetical protein